MIDGKRFKFGYGDISVGGDPDARKIFFQQFKPPAKCGDNVNPDGVEWIGEQIFIKIDYEDYVKLNQLLDDVKAREISEFTFKNYVFDFTNYNEKSVEVCKQKSRQAINLYLLALAC